MPTKLDEKIKLLGQKLDEVKSIWDEADKAGVEDLPAEQKQRVINLNKEIEDLNAEVSEGKQFKSMREGHEGLLNSLNQINRPAFDHGGSSRGGEAVKSIGEMFTEESEFKSWVARIMPNGNIPNGFRVGESPALEVNAMMKTLITGLSATSAGAMTQIDYRPLVDLPFRPLTLRDLVSKGMTGADTVEYPRVTGYTNNAAPVAEATNTSNGTKPESGLALEKVTETVKTIAHWIPATKRALADAGQIRTLIDNFLRQGLEEELEDQMINGDGTGENFTGVANVSGLGSQAYDTNILVTARKARTKVRVQGRATPTAYVMHPNDWEAFDLSIDNEARYYFGGPMVMGNPRLWGLPVVECEGCTEGTPYVADWRQLVLWDREQANIRVSDSHANFFIQNLVAILAEMRAAFGVFRPAAVVEIDLTA